MRTLVNPKVKIDSAESAREWIKRVHSEGDLFHFEDPLEEKGFSDDEVDIVGATLDALYDHLEDPCMVAVEIMGGGE